MCLYMNRISESELEKIEKYLLDWGIEYQDFYDEMLDHFIEDIEHQMSEGQLFTVAFYNTTHKFAKKTFKKGFFSEEYLGLKAYEQAYIHQLEKGIKKDIQKKLLAQISTWRIFIWIVLISSAVVFKEYILARQWLKVSLAFLYLCFVFSPFFFVRSSVFSGVFKSYYDWFEKPLVKRKATLINQTKNSLMFRYAGVGFTLINSLLNLLRYTTEGFFKYDFKFYLGVFIFLSGASLVWAQLELIFENNSAEN